MEEETQEVTQETDDSLSVALNEIENLKQTTVSKDEYNKLKADNETLIRRLAQERPIVEESIKTPTEQERYEQLQKNSRRLMNEDLNGYEYAQLLIENEDIENELGIDPFGADDEQSRSLKARNDATSRVLRETLKECKDRPDMFSKILESKLDISR